MPIGPFGEIIGTTGTLPASAQNYKSKVIAPRNPKLVRGEKPLFKMKPSQFMFQMSMDTEKKLANMHTMNIPKKVELLDMSETSHQKISSVAIDDPMFQPFPSEIFFQNYKPFETYEVPLVLRNNDKVPRLVKVTQADSPYFKIISPPTVGNKVGPGLPTTFILRFTPEENKDYNHECVCITEREKFVVPVRAIGSRAILDFPDEVNFPPNAVKNTLTKTLLVRNIGNKDARFSLSTEKPFVVSPENGVLPQNESLQIHIEFCSSDVGDQSSDLILHYDTGEDIYISLYGSAHDANVRLDKSTIRIERTFLSMANQRTVTISNRSDIIANFRWTRYATQEEENQQKIFGSETVANEESTERNRFLEECMVDPSLRDKLSILTRTFQNRRKAITSDKLLFQDDAFIIEPVEGVIWPNSSAEVNVIFRPEDALSYNCMAFCDVTGRESRLPLRIRGDGIGPSVQFSYDELDMGKIFINSTHTYELVLANKGDIDAIFTLQPSSTLFGQKFSFNPSEGIVMPDGHQAIQVTFHSNVLGDVNETFQFQVDGSPDQLNITFRGTVIGPTFHFDIPHLKFNTISYGFLNTKTCTLMNTALVPMSFRLHVPADGTGSESVCSTSEYDSTLSEAGSGLSPKEFDIIPSSGTIQPQSEIKVRVELCSNTCKKYEMVLVVDVEGVGDEVLTLPITAKCIVPPITVLTPLLDFGRCFLCHPYEHNVRLQNDTNLPAKYELVPQVVNEHQMPPMTYTSPKPKGILEPHTTTNVPIVITPQWLEELAVNVQFFIFGGTDVPLNVTVSCVGEGPVVNIVPLSLDWGRIPVLLNTAKSVMLSNESLISAKFTAHMVRTNSVWTVEPNSGEIAPEEQLELQVTACLTDCVRFQDKLQINFLNGSSRVLPLSAYGHGTTITSDPPMTPTLNLGPHFSKLPFSRTFTLKNEGRRHQSIVWSMEGFPFINRPIKRTNNLAPITKRNKKNLPPPEPVSEPVFKLTPHRMELNPGDSVDILLEGIIDDPQVVKETLLCHAIIGRAGGKELIMKVAITCEFIAPLMQFSSDKLEFCVEKAPKDELEILSEDISMTNVSSLPLTTKLTLLYPFSMVMLDDVLQQEVEVLFGIGEEFNFKIKFDPAYKEDAHSRKEESILSVQYKEHPHVDEINLSGEVSFPNLHFEKTDVDFGCILNDTEVTRYINITNNSPLEVKYKWSFLVDNNPVATFRRQPPQYETDEMGEEMLEEEYNMADGEHDVMEQEVVPQVQIISNSPDTLLKIEKVIEPEDDDGEEKKDAEKPVPEEELMEEQTQEDNRELEHLTLNPDATVVADDSDQLEVEEIVHIEETNHNLVTEERTMSRLGTPKPQPAMNRVLATLLQQNQQIPDLSVEEIFDILPLYGTLKPGDTEMVTLTFYGHADMSSKALAICEVEGGPCYELNLSGEASLVNYHFDCLDVDYGRQMYDHIATSEITLTNTGHVGFEFVGLGMDPAMAVKPKYGVPVMIPHKGFLEAGSQQTLLIKFIPGIPDHFNTSFQIQVAHFEPDVVNISGEGVFPRISLDLPRIWNDEGHYEKLLTEAKMNLTKRFKRAASMMTITDGGELVSGEETYPQGSGSQEYQQPQEVPNSHTENTAEAVKEQPMNFPDLEVQMEVERLVVCEFAREQQLEMNRPDILTVQHTMSESQISTNQHEKKSKKKQKARLPDYKLDFGHVVLGTVTRHVVTLTNTGWFNASFRAERQHLHQHGFYVELDPVKDFPGAPEHNILQFPVSFDPRGANLGLGEVDTIIPINIVNGPQVCIYVHANVTMPDMKISSDVLDFSDVRCGECRIITVQLYNHKDVRCDWNSLPLPENKKKVDKHVPMHLRRKMRNSMQKPRTFEMMPATGSLMPGQHSNVQVKFMPIDERHYEERIIVHIQQSSCRAMLLCRGSGLEPQLTFADDKQMIEFGPILPHSVGDEQEVVLHNPCPFPIEIYNLEFDKGYLEEEKILRLMKGYDEYNTILLPPRQPAEKLPQELLDYYEEQMKKLEEIEKERRQADEAAEAERKLQEEREREGEMKEGDENEGRQSEAQSETTKIDDGATTVLSHRTSEPQGGASVDGHKTDRTDQSTSGIKSEDARESESKAPTQQQDTIKEDDGESSAGSSTMTVGDLEITPVSQAIARHLGIDLSPEGKAARNRFGIAIIVHGAPMSGKTTTSIKLAKKYQAALLTVDGVVQEAITEANTVAGKEARKLCEEAGKKRMEELRGLEGEDGDKKMGGLSMEALNAHTQGAPVNIASVSMAHSVAQSMTSNRKTSTISDQKNKHHAGMTAGKGAPAAATEGASQVPSTPPPLAAPIARRLSMCRTEDELWSTILPGELLVNILADRLRLSDCQRGVIFDGLETVFSLNMYTTALAILTAFNNRSHLYCVTLKLDYAVLKEQELQRQKEQEELDRMNEEAEKKRLEEMDEDEYDALTEEQKAEVDQKRLQVKRERIRREREEQKLETERREREAQEAEQRRLEEEKASKKKKRGNEKDGKDTKEKDSKKGNKEGKVPDSRNQDRVTALKSQEGKKGDHDHLMKTSSSIDRPESRVTDRVDSSAEVENKKKKDKGKDGKRPISHEVKPKDGDAPPQEEVKEATVKESDLILMQRFKTFEHNIKDVSELMDHWERAAAKIRPATPSEGAEDGQEQQQAHPSSGKKSKKIKELQKAKEREAELKASKENKESETPEDLDASSEQHSVQLSEEEKREKRLEAGIGLVNVMVDCSAELQTSDVDSLSTRVAASGKLPTAQEVLNCLGMGPNGPAIPPAANFGVVPFPVKRHAPPGAEGGHYVFIAASPDDPNIGQDENKSEADKDETDKTMTPDTHKEDHITPTRSGRNKSKDRQRKTSAKSRMGRRGSAVSPPQVPTPASEIDSLADFPETKTPKLTQFRWTIPADGDVILRLRFQSEDLGQFDQTMNFEIVGTRRRYQLYCRGICAFPTISREPRIVFPHRKKNKLQDEIVHKKFILATEIFEFGPLLVGKSRDRYKEGKYPENMEKLVISNTSPLDADISFCFLQDSKADTYMLDPPTMQLKPGQQQDLSIWAYPKGPGKYEDSLICCIKENPEPIVFKLLAYGVRPELELEKKVLNFEKVLLHRKETRSLFLRNTQMLPVAWRLTGLENLGDDFSVSHENGIIEPHCEFELSAYFRAMKAVAISRKTIRLEISDVDNILGLLYAENIPVHAEAYDVALDMTFPKGADGGIDFDVIRVSEEKKDQCSLKNKGKYDISYSFSFEPTEGCPEDVCNMFSVVPQKGVLSAVDRPSQVQVIFKSKREVTVKEQPILRCQVIEPNLAEGGEVIASIPIKLTVRSSFSKYSITPVSDINFGAMLVNSKKTRTFIIRNEDDKFDFKYTIQKMERREPAMATGVKGRKGIRDGSSSGRSVAKPKKAESVRDVGPTGGGGGGSSNQKVQLGMFTVYPALGFILPGGKVEITVDCTAETAGKCEEEIAIDIKDRDPSDNPAGIPYRLVAEACIPSINVADFGLIFEEHRVVKNLSVWHHSNQVETCGVFGEDENRFVFNNVLVGAKAQARFKIKNTSKVPCDVQFIVKPIISKHMTRSMNDVFEIEPNRAQITSHGFVYATITFTPPSMQYFSATFEAAIEGTSQSQAKGRNLMFEMSGEGNLPRISIHKPSIRNKKGLPLLLFKRNLINTSQTLPMEICNDGTLPSKVDIDMTDPDGVFMLTPAEGTKAAFVDQSDFEVERKKPHIASVVVNVGECASFNVTFTPQLTQRSQGQLRLTVLNNQYEDTLIQLVGEGYEDDITLSNVHSILLANQDPEQEEGNMADDDVAAAKSNHIRFGDCQINESRTLSFTMTNHSSDESVRFLWADHPRLRVSPHVGHLHSGCAKDMSVTFCSDAPDTLEEVELSCKVSKITFDVPISQVADWDDSKRSVKWIDSAPSPSGSLDSQQKGDQPSAPPTPAGRPAKKKVIETDPEPTHHEVEDSARNVNLLVSAVADYCKYKCKTDNIRFKDTLMLQTRVFDFHVSNKGSVTMSYNWQIMAEQLSNVVGGRSVTFEEGGIPERPPTSMELVARPGSAASTLISSVEYNPFTIEPVCGTILPGKKGNFTLKFSPLDVQEYEAKLVCGITNLDNKEGPTITVGARGLMPYCHFELEDSDYISSARRNPELCGPKGAPAGTTLDPNTKVIEFKNVGIKSKSICRFFVVNPTTHHYTFKWQNEDEVNPKAVSNMKCLTPSGGIASGKKTEIIFEFNSTTLDLVESFWRFDIAEEKISVPFLLVGATQDPNIHMDRSHLNFKSLLIGHETLEVIHLINNEDQPFTFNYLQSSCLAPGCDIIPDTEVTPTGLVKKSAGNKYDVCLRIEPMSGTIMPKQSLPISIYFTPKSEKEVNFNLQCKLQHKERPLKLNVKAEGYSMNCLVLREEIGGQKMELFPDQINEVSFGAVEVNEKSIRNMFIVNSGKFNFDYNWSFVSGDGSRYPVSVTPEAGGVVFGERQKCQLAFCPTGSLAMSRGCELQLQISNGPSYILRVQGAGVPPGLRFSFQSHDFKSCFIHRAGMPDHHTILQLCNHDTKEISVDCLYTPTAHLHHNFEAQVIPPGESVDVKFTFFPREAKLYNETVAFEINGLSKQSVQIKGHGTEMKVEVADPKKRMLKLGALRVGQTVKRRVPIINRSPAPITFHLSMAFTSELLNDNKILKVSPTSSITLKANGGTADVDVVFAPNQRIPQFVEEVILECAGMYQPLFVMTGSCHGVDINLDMESVPFGAVVENSANVRKLVMSNTGDIGARYEWDVQKFGKDFSILPVKGYISPGMEVPFEINFHPKAKCDDIRIENIKCKIEGGKPLLLTVTGMCIAVVAQKETLNFSIHVRQRETKSLLVPNRTNMAWKLRPVITGEFWTGPDTFNVDPQSSKGYDLVYRPLVMTTQDKKHQGSVFFPLPDGTGFLYNITGSAEPPRPNGKISREVPCKTMYAEMLSVNNWLKKAQRFKVKWDMIRPDKLDPGTSMKGLDYIDVPANAKRNYKLSFHAHKEGTTQIKVIFTNEQTSEYQFYEVTFKAGRPGVIDTIDLVTPVRKSVRHTLYVENPLAYSVTFTASCNVGEILLPGHLTVPQQSEGTFTMEYLPLRVGENEGHMELNCTDLGVYSYDLRLKATSAGPERAYYYRSCLGTSQTQAVKFMNFAKQKTDYYCKVDNSDFHVDKTVAAAPGSTSGTEVSIDVMYEPSHIGESRAMLSVNSTVGGDYTFPLFGTCISPKPQGPYVVRAGSTASVTFRNVFAHTMAFIFQVDNPLFHVVKSGENIRSHKDHRVTVGFDGNDNPDGSKASVMGKLIISCAKSAGGATNAQWIYYLKGVTPENR